MSYFPMFVELKGRTVLVVGGGAVAGRRIGVLLPFGCRIVAVSPKLSETLFALVRDRRLEWREKRYEAGDLTAGQRPVFVLAAAGDPAVNGAVVSDCRRAGIPVNNASKKEDCDFYFPGIAKNGEIVAGVCAGGGDHHAASAVTGAVRTLIDRETWKS